MSDKYFKDDGIALAQLRHDLASLVEPLALSIRIMDSDRREKAVFIQNELLNKLRSIVENLAASGDHDVAVIRPGDRT